MTYKGLNYAAPCLADFQTTLAFLAAVTSELSRLPGFDVRETPLWDWMLLSPLGIEARSNGQALYELAVAGRLGRFRGEWKVRIGIALKRAWGDFRAYCDTYGLEHSQPQFTAVTLSVAAGEGSRPELKAPDEGHSVACRSHSRQLARRPQS